MTHGRGRHLITTSRSPHRTRPNPRSALSCASLSKRNSEALHPTPKTYLGPRPSKDLTGSSRIRASLLSARHHRNVTPKTSHHRVSEALSGQSRVRALVLLARNHRDVTPKPSKPQSCGVEGFHRDVRIPTPYNSTVSCIRPQSSSLCASIVSFVNLSLVECDHSNAQR